MSDWKENLKNLKAYKGGGGGMKKCSCGKLIKNDRFDTCFECSKKNRQDVHGYDKSRERLPDNYLAKSYFDENGQLRAGIFKEDAKLVSKVLASWNTTPTSLRVFYNKLKAIECKYKSSSNDFDLVKPDLYAFERDVAYQVSRGVVSEEFRKFINVNAEIAAKGPKEFKGFVEHFLSVLSFFKDVSKK
ncbi:MAG TPA: type III-A CRISPR-associated protein Csm2 [Nitrospirae bacterium]|nr:hypothetical protein BMS3Abin06_01565 [bacterium BMS3Abin06]HDH12658.1 type III-A CRISPR-associated protein Csm2 [Nitrospirota bacterium]HDY99966.1 type III-A CRISPR-associated protein Csm2 [Nitrospirota bacterium]